MDHVIRKPKISRSDRFRTLWEKIDYACRDTATGSLLPVPPGTTRERLYCGQCKAKKCLFTGQKPISAREKARQDAEEQRVRHERYLRDKAQKRAMGLDTTRRPLQRTCWNCVEIRQKQEGYVCRFKPEAEPENMGIMIHRHAEGCEAFGLRRVVDIPVLDSGD